MAAKYSIGGSQNLASSEITALSIAAVTATLRRAWVYEFIVGENVTAPADNAVLHTAQRFTASGTDTAVVAARLDVADAESDMNCGVNHTGEPTYTATEELLQIGMNTRATFRWVAAPGGMLVIPAVNEEGIGWSSVHASSTALWHVSAMYEE